MVAVVPMDESLPIQYCFIRTDAQGSPVAAGGSGWIESPAWEETGLVTGLTYYYRVATRDRYANMSDLSPVAEVTLVPDTKDINPPLPNPPVWMDTPAQYYFGGTYWHYMAVVPVADPEGNCEEYYFECVDNSAYDSGWVNALTVPVLGVDYPAGAMPPAPNERWVRVGAANLEYRYRVKTAISHRTKTRVAGR